MPPSNLAQDLFQAYFDARKNKRNTHDQLAFEVDCEHNLFELLKELKERTYEISKSICFIVFSPVQREIFAGNFRDRIVHHLVFNYINPFFERIFIHDSYSCRMGKGTLCGIKRIDHFIRSCSRNYTKDCYILKLDIKGYFMAIDQNILYAKIEKTLLKFSAEINFDFEFIQWLLKKIIFHNPIKNCYVKGKESDWDGLPESKSLFCAEAQKGLPIGNLTSQLFGNIYLNDLDHFIKQKLHCRYYGRYVDDFVIVYERKEYLASIIPLIRKYLSKNLQLELHPLKIYLQHYSKGVSFLGSVIKPHRIYVRNRTKGNFYQKIQKWNDAFKAKNYKFSPGEWRQFLAMVNSYLGTLKHFRTYKLRKKMLLSDLSAYFWNFVYISNNYGKLTMKRQDLS